MKTGGNNAPSGEYLTEACERIERLRERKAEIGDQERAVFAEVKAHGYSTKILKRLLKVRAMSPNDRDEEDALLDVYMSATGLARETPLFRAVGLMAVDTAARDDVIRAFSAIVPRDGDVIVRMSGAPVRLFRDASGAVQVEDYVEPTPGDWQGSPADAGQPAPPRPNVPDVDEAGAYALGGKAFKDDKPIVANPFPAHDKRRREWDKGWRDASGGDGMGPSGKGA